MKEFSSMACDFISIVENLCLKNINLITMVEWKKEKEKKKDEGQFRKMAGGFTVKCWKKRQNFRTELLKKQRTRSPIPPPFLHRAQRRRRGRGPAVEIQEDKFSKCKFSPKPLNFGCFGVGFWISIVVGGLYFVLYGVVFVITVL